MKIKTKIFAMMCLLLFAVLLSAQNSSDTKIDLLSGEIQTNGLPAGWETAGDNFDCTIKFDENKAIYFERQSKDEKCSFVFTQDMPNGVYLLETAFKVDGNGAEILLDGKPLKKQQKITVTDGKLRVGIQTKGGKAWGWIRKMSIARMKSK